MPVSSSTHPPDLSVVCVKLAAIARGAALSLPRDSSAAHMGSCRWGYTGQWPGNGEHHLPDPLVESTDGEEREAGWQELRGWKDGEFGLFVRGSTVVYYLLGGFEV